jgi:hypothetical protein
VAVFMLPESCWIQNYYVQMVPLQEAFLKQYAGNTSAEGLIANLQLEAQLYDKYKAYYGYVFYIGRKI